MAEKTKAGSVMGVWWEGAETSTNVTNVSPPDSGGSGNGNNQDDQNNQTGETGSSGHKLLDQYNQLVAEGKAEPRRLRT